MELLEMAQFSQGVQVAIFDGGIGTNLACERPAPKQPLGMRSQHGQLVAYTLQVVLAFSNSWRAYIVTDRTHFRMLTKLSGAHT